ncbi:MAG TPA: Gfo/Idh/MocA family oxidoreductase, partial [Marivita sp.]|nr:Gfo/Idh/MocA family oxidoreductase [Marivita sp.]
MTGVVSIIGCGFVADLYMRSLQAMEGITVAGVYDKDAARLKTFCAHWNVPAVDTLDTLLDRHPRDGLVLNLTNPSAHFEISSLC